MQTRFRGRVWLFGEDISTDHIITAGYLGTTDPKVFAEHCLENVDARFAKEVKPGDLVVAGPNFGCGSSREQAVLAFTHLGVSAIVAPSFARIFFRNAINQALPVVECPGIHEKVKPNEEIELDLERGEVKTASGEILTFRPLPPHVLEILEAGGLVPKLKRDLAARRASS
ncbi:MAG: 3-isopropylmalate dehydratase small subunit [Euryarchaeota archaeon]|nr:3-isopropylmalate dehydratase small subunit [Euryarchaeota archaeon]